MTNLYLDTSVLGGYFDEEWQAPTRELWRQMEDAKFRFLTSTVTVVELTEAPERVRKLFSETFPSENILEVTALSEDLASAYMSRQVLTPKYTDDARHVAICSLAKVEYLVSWNFRHLVNVEREKGFNAVNRLRGHQPIRIVNPLELIYGDNDQDL